MVVETTLEQSALGRQDSQLVVVAAICSEGFTENHPTGLGGLRGVNKARDDKNRTNAATAI
jgi:hypothetical protein